MSRAVCTSVVGAAYTLVIDVGTGEAAAIDSYIIVLTFGAVLIRAGQTVRLQTSTYTSTRIVRKIWTVFQTKYLVSDIKVIE